MFDKIIFSPQSGPTHTTSTTTEHRAPTDESVKLLSEFEQKAIDKTIATIVCNDNTLNFKCVIHEDYMNKGVNVFYRYSINGTDYEGEKKFPKNELAVQDVVETVLEAMSRQIAETLLASTKQDNVMGGMCVHLLKDSVSR